MGAQGQGSAHKGVSPFRATRFRRMAMMALRMSSSSAVELTCTSSKSTGTHACLGKGNPSAMGPHPSSLLEENELIKTSWPANSFANVWLPPHQQHRVFFGQRRVWDSAEGIVSSRWDGEPCVRTPCWESDHPCKHNDNVVSRRWEKTMLPNSLFLIRL